MADDISLPFPAEAVDATALPCPPTWPYQQGLQSGRIEFRRQPYPFRMGGQFDRVNGNRITIPYRVRSDKFFKAVSCILGWSTTTGAPAGGLLRRLPIRDEQGLGMYAVRIPSYRFIASSKIKPGPNDTTDPFNPKPLSRIYGDINDPDDPTGPSDGVDELPKLWMDDAYTAPDIFDFNATTGWEQSAIKETRWCILNIEFAQLPYAVLSDTSINSPGNPFGYDAATGGGDERYRYMWSEFNPSIEWITTKAITLKFGPGAVNATGASIAGQQCGTEAGFLRPTGELIIHWEKVPADAVANLFNRFEYDETGMTGPRYGTVNQAAFKAPLYSTIKTYAAETLMFMGCRPDIRWQPHGILEYDLTYRFSYRQGGWNKFLTGQTSAPQPVVRQDGSAVYQAIDFAELFQWA